VGNLGLKNLTTVVRVLSFVFSFFFIQPCLANGECSFAWKPGQGLPGLDGPVVAVTKWDPDGDGPLPELLVIGGYFSIAGNVVANNIAAWDGTSWHPLGSGMNDIVWALTVYNGELIAGGYFTTVDGISANCIARWNGSSWQPLGNGMNGAVYALTIYNGQLIAGGDFSTAGDANANNIASWDGNSWQPLPQSVNGAGLITLDFCNGLLMTGTKVGLDVDDGAIQINANGSCGNPFNHANCPDISTTAFNVVDPSFNDGCLNGADFPVNPGVPQIEDPLCPNSPGSAPCLPEPSAGIYHTSIVVNNGQTLTLVPGIHIIDGGLNVKYGGTIIGDDVMLFIRTGILDVRGQIHITPPISGTYEGVAIFQSRTNYNDAAISSSSGASGMYLEGTLYFPNNKLRVTSNAATTELGNQLIVGSLELIGNSTFIINYDGRNWTPLSNGVNGIVRSLTIYNGQLIAGGDFTTAGDVSANNIAQWDGSTWQSLNIQVGQSVKAMTVYNDQLIVGGNFPVMAWNGNYWNDLGMFMDSVYVFTVFNGKLIAGGFADERWYENVIYSWDGDSWKELGNKMSWGYPPQGYPVVYALTDYKDQLIVGGCFAPWPIIGFTPAFITRWAGDSWQTLGGGITDAAGISALAVYNDELIAGFGMVADITKGKNIMRWDGSGWKGLGPMGFNSVVGAMAVYKGQLIVGGDYIISGNYAINSWDGSSWKQLGDGYFEHVNAFTVYNDDLIAGGYRFGVDEVGLTSIARWDGSSWYNFSGNMDEWRFSAVNALTVYKGELIAGGEFMTNEGETGDCIAKWDGSSWQPLAWLPGVQNDYGDPVFAAFMIYDNELIVGGNFIWIEGIDASYIARWDGDSWQPLGGGMNGPVYALTVYNGELIAGGNFTNYIARWNGNSWMPLESGTNRGVLSLTVFNGELIAGGCFTTAGSNISPYFARWGKPNPMVGDLNHDCSVDYLDLALFCDRWLDDDCMYTGFCGESDINYNFKVDFADFAKFAQSW
jgi:hypothetical protein